MTDSKRLTLRLPPELHQLLLGSAKEDRRSLNREIEFLLWQAFQVSADAFADTRNAVRPVAESPNTVRPVASRRRGSPSRTTRSD